MFHNKWIIILINILIITISTYLVYILYPKVHPAGGMALENTAQEIEKKSFEIARALGIESGDYDIHIRLRHDNSLIDQSQTTFGLIEGNKRLRENIPGYHWLVEWNRPEDITQRPQPIKPGRRAHRFNQVSMRIDSKGYLFGLGMNIPDTLRIPNISRDEAENIASDFINKYTCFSNLSKPVDDNDTLSTNTRIHIPSNDIQQRQRVDYGFNWSATLENHSNPVEIDATMKGSIISDIKIQYFEEDARPGDPEMMSGIGAILFLVVIAILVIYLTYTKSRNYEIQFRTGIKVAVFLVIFIIIQHAVSWSNLPGWASIMSILIIPIFVGGSFIIVFAVSESLGRETWQEKLIPLDLIMKGHIIHSYIGLGIMRGIVFGLSGFSLLLILSYILNIITPTTAVLSGEASLDAFSHPYPGLMILNSSIWKMLYISCVNGLLLTSFLYPVFKKKWLTILVVSLVYPFLIGNMIHPFLPGIVIQAMAFALITWSFIKYDFLVNFVALLSYSALEYLPAFFHTENDSFITLVILFSIVFVYTIWSIISKDRITDFKEIEPALARLINERQRMKQQLEVAREVQLGLFPRSKPIFKGLDIAADCIPAFEVGGDYYDFIKTDANRISLAIGDVSGKGTRAAFYMTLVKGFLKALARYTHSPAEIQKEMNGLFFENTRHDAFISMIYAVFDMKENRLVMARSGHNPVIHYHQKKNEVTLIRGEGLALGLEKGELFDQLIEESTIQLRRGDFFIFYTDGLTEARNKTREEFGEERLQKLIIEQSNLTAEGMLRSIYKEVKKFSKGTHQHDDMTLIIVKVDF